MYDETLELLKAARALIRTPDHWTSKAFARNKDNTASSSYDPSACQWCALGSLRRARYNLGLNSYVVINATKELIGDREQLMSFNDDPNTSHKDIINLFDEAIKKKINQ